MNIVGQRPPNKAGLRFALEHLRREDLVGWEKI
jgi:hypothetical protein